MIITFIALSCLAVLVTWLPMLRVPHRLVRFFDFPRVQLFVLLTALLVGSFFIFEGFSWPSFALQAGLLVSASYQASWILAFTTMFRKEVKVSKTPDAAHVFTLFVYNVRMENKRKADMISAVLRADPDMVLANEIDQGWADALTEIHAQYPHRVLMPLANTYGMGLYSRLPLKDAKVEFKVENDIPSIHTRVQLPGGPWFDFYGMHPKPPDLHNNTEARDAELVMTGLEIKRRNQPAVIAGDLNDVAWSNTTRLFKKLSGMLDPRVGRGFYNTYSVFVPFFRYPLDHLFITPQWQLVKLKRLPACGSDHFPVMVRLEYKPDKAYKQPVEAPEKEDLEYAHEILQVAEERG